MQTTRIKTNIIELSKLKEKPCKEWLDRFKDGKIDAYTAFREYGEKYAWLYQNSDYDLIGWEIKNRLFDWGKYSGMVARYCPENFNSNFFDWDFKSDYVAEFCPEKIDAKRYNWSNFSWAIARYCPEKLDTERFNWKGFAWAVLEFCPEKLPLMPEKYKKIYSNNN